jgi:hypothetical protein
VPTPSFWAQFPQASSRFRLHPMILFKFILTLLP